MYLLYSKLYWNNLVITKITPQNTFVKYVYTMLHASIIGFTKIYFQCINIVFDNLKWQYVH